MKKVTPKVSPPTQFRKKPRTVQELEALWWQEELNPQSNSVELAYMDLDTARWHVVDAVALIESLVASNRISKDPRYLASLKASWVLLEQAILTIDPAIHLAWNARDPKVTNPPKSKTKKASSKKR